MYVMSLALQAVVDQWTQISNDQEATQASQSSGQFGAGAANGIGTGPTFDTLVSLYKPNERYIREVGDAARSILRHIVEGLAEENYLRHAPVRTYFRILSAMIFLLKVSEKTFCAPAFADHLTAICLWGDRR